MGKGKDNLMEKYYELVQLLQWKVDYVGEDIGEFIDNVIVSGIYEKDELIFFLEEKLAVLKKIAVKKVIVK